MNNVSDEVTVKYNEVVRFCPHCGEKMDKPETSNNLSIVITKELAEGYAGYADGWKNSVREDTDEEFKEEIRDFIFETITFITDSDVGTDYKFGEEEIGKVSKFIKDNFSEAE